MENNELERMALYYKALDCYKRRDPESHDEGFLFLQEAAEKGSSDAMKLIGVLKMSGQYDPYPKKDLPSAVEWYRKAAEAGDEEAMYWLSQCYEMGMGVKVSKREAKKWRKEAIAHGFELDEPEPEEKQPAPKPTPKPAPKPAKQPAVEETKPVNRPAVQAEMPKPAARPAEGTEQTARLPVISEEEKPEIKPAPKKPEEEVKPLEPLSERAVDVKSILTGKGKDAAGQSTAEEEAKSAAARAAAYQKVAMPAVIDFASDVKEADRRDDEDAHLFSDSYQRASLFRGISTGIIIGIVLMGILYLVIHSIIDTQQAIALFLGATGVVLLIGVALGAIWGIKRAGSRYQKEDAYRKTAFYQSFHADLSSMNEQQSWCYRIYRSMEKNYLPVSNRKVPDLTHVREYRGAMYPGWVFGTGTDDNRPEFVFLTDRAIYVICTRYLKGKLTGTYKDLDWMLEVPEDREGLVKVENLVIRNELQTERLKAELSRVSKIPIGDIPFYNIVFLNDEVDISGLRVIGGAEKTMLVQGPYDKLRIAIGGKESTIHTHGVRLDAVIDAFGTLGSEWLHRELAANPR